MTKPKSKAAKGGTDFVEHDSAAPKKPDAMTVRREVDRTVEETWAKIMLGPESRHGSVARIFAGKSFGCKPEDSDLDRAIEVVRGQMEAVRNGDLSGLTDALTGQLSALDSVFSFMLLKAVSNADAGYLEAATRYYGLAMKAQANCRVTAESLAKILRGGKQTIQIIHVHEGGQAVVADTVNNGANANGIGREEAERAGDVAVAALLSQEPPGVTLPGASDARPGAVPAPRREGDGSASGQH